jgi:hypothetical protein
LKDKILFLKFVFGKSNTLPERNCAEQRRRGGTGSRKRLESGDLDKYK